MDRYDHELDHFSSEGLWRLSKFSIEALQPLECLPWNTTLSGQCQLDILRDFVNKFLFTRYSYILF